ncbi:MAG: SHOCT domain-containing protein [Syntrophobacterales bacterium]|nr:MAG: SHOCT domain-containing protein [Syntrophobacterales bacterium]
MSTTSDKSGAELFKGVLLAHLIIGLHVGVLALIGLLVIFFGGLARYWGWILLGGLTAAALLGFFLYRKVKSRGRDLYRDIRSAPVMPGGTLEVSLLGGLASVKFSKPSDAAALPNAAALPALLEDSATRRIRELGNLARMYEKNLITREEFEQAKAAMFNPPARPGYEPGTIGN